MKKMKKLVKPVAFLLGAVETIRLYKKAAKTVDRRIDDRGLFPDVLPVALWREESKHDDSH